MIIFFSLFDTFGKEIIIIICFLIFVGKESSSLNLNTNFTDTTTQNDDDFGDFVGPESTQIDESNCKTPSGFLNDQLWVDNSSSKPVPGTLSDNRSVSSLELPGVTLSRHGSLPSLDLNLFPTTDDTSEKVLNSQVCKRPNLLSSPVEYHLHHYFFLCQHNSLQTGSDAWKVHAPYFKLQPVLLQILPLTPS